MAVVFGTMGLDAVPLEVSGFGLLVVAQAAERAEGVEGAEAIVEYHSVPRCPVESLFDRYKVEVEHNATEGAVGAEAILEYENFLP
jgi:hypothetical protein